MLNGFKKFIMQGNVIDLAVAVVIGAAFGDVVKKFTAALIDPLVREVLGGGVEGGTYTLSTGNVLDFALVINALITFVITAAVVYFVFVLPMIKLQERRKSGDEASEPTDNEKMISLLEEIARK